MNKRVLSKLRDANGGWVDEMWFHERHIRNMETRICELIKKGHPIERCLRSDLRELKKGQANVACYRLVEAQGRLL